MLSSSLRIHDFVNISQIFHGYNPCYPWFITPRLFVKWCKELHQGNFKMVVEFYHVEGDIFHVQIDLSISFRNICSVLLESTSQSQKYSIGKFRFWVKYFHFWDQIILFWDPTDAKILLRLILAVQIKKQESFDRRNLDSSRRNEELIAFIAQSKFILVAQIYFLCYGYLMI